MSQKTVGDPEPSYWENSFKLWYTGYQNSKFRQGLIHIKSVEKPELDSHDISHETTSPTQYRMDNRLYKPPYGVPYPRECSKILDKYMHCRWDYKVYSYADDVPQCNEWKDAVFDGCPHWVVENMAIKKRFMKRAEAIDNLTYRRAMEISDYNK